MYKILLIILFLPYLYSYTNLDKKLDQKADINSTDSLGIKKINNILLSKNKAVYLVHDKSSFGHEFGYIRIMDLDTKEGINIVDNTYYNNFPRWIYNGEQILFGAARIGDLNWLKITRNNAWKQLYLFNLMNRKTTKLFDETELNNKPDIHTFVGLTLNQELNESYFSNEDNNIYALSYKDKKLSLIKSLKKEDIIFNMSLSYDEKYLAVEFSNLSNINDFSLVIINVKNNEDIYKLTQDKYVKFLGWSNESYPYIRIGKKISILNFKKKILLDTNFKIDGNKYLVQKIFTEKNGNMVMLISIKNRDSRYFTYEEIAKYDIKSNRLEWITNDKKVKSELDCYFTK